MSLDYQFQLASAVVGKPAPSQAVLLVTATVTMTIPADMDGSSGSAGVNPSGTATYILTKNNVQVGTVQVSTSGVFTFASGGLAITLGFGDRLALLAPSSQDATLSDVSIVILATPALPLFFGVHNGSGQFLKVDPSGSGLLLQNDANGSFSQIFNNGQFNFEKQDVSPFQVLLNTVSSGAIDYSVTTTSGPAQALGLVVTGQTAATGIVIQTESAGHQLLGIEVMSTGGGFSIFIGQLDSSAANEIGVEVDLSSNSRTTAFSYKGRLNSTATAGVAYLADGTGSAPDNGNWGFYQSGTANNARNNFDAPVRYKPTTFSTLPSPSSTTKGMIACITDSTTNVWGANIAGSGGNVVMAFNNGTNWTVMAK